jgi:flagellin
MKVNHNIAAVLANHRLKTTEKGLAASVGRLSSGYKINSAKDNPAGFAIAHKMSTQLRGLEKASDNALDGVSAIETAEGALNEVQSMLQRLRELAVQAANDTYTLDDRQSIQIEAEKLQEEIERISKDTEFNKKSLLDGTFDTRAYSNTDGVSARLISDSVSPGEYQFTVTAVATKTTVSCGAINTAAFGVAQDIAETGKIQINGVSVEISTSESVDEVYGKIREAAENAGVEVSGFGSAFTFTAEEYGSKWDVDITATPSTIANALGLASGTKEMGKDANITLIVDTNTPTSTSQFKNTASCSADGEFVKVTDRGGFEMTIKVENEKYQDIVGSTTATLIGQTTTVDVKDFGYMSLQIGANEDQTMDVRIPDISLENMGIENLNYLTFESASRTITQVDNALSFASSVRAKLGAYQNRLDHTISSLDVADESLTSSYSRIMDTDMAEEMTTYTQYNVLQQAGVSVLAQANDLPQTVLQLLQ